MSSHAWKSSCAMVAIIVLVAFGSPLGAVTITALGDTYINSVSANANFAPLEILNASPQSITLLNFPLTALPMNVQPAQIAKATLQLWVQKASVNPAGYVNVYRVTTSWNGPSVTWATGPGFSPVLLTKALTGGSNYYLELDVTDQVKSWLGGQVNYGLAVNSTGDVLFDSKENTGTSHAPLLDITVTSGSSVVHDNSVAVCEDSVPGDLNQPFRKCANLCTGRVIIQIYNAYLCAVTADLNSCGARDYSDDSWSWALCCVCDQNAP